MTPAPAAGARDTVPAGNAGQPGAGTSAPSAGAEAKPEPVELADVVERDPRYLVGISYPPVAREYPGLAKLLRDYADDARAELMRAVEGLGGEKPTAPYDLSLAFTEEVATPRLVTIAADGSSYTGGAHGNPILARFNWLPDRDERLTAARLVPDPAGWKLVSDYAREQLATALSQRIDESGYAPGERAQLLEGGMQMIEQGTAPEPANFDQFEPIVGADGRIRAIRFVFPPYQVGPYSDGVQSVDVPGAVLLPVVAPGYRSLFQGS
jgi:hypothetical protein